MERSAKYSIKKTLRFCCLKFFVKLFLSTCVFIMYFTKVLDIFSKIWERNRKNNHFTSYIFALREPKYWFTEIPIDMRIHFLWIAHFVSLSIWICVQWVLIWHPLAIVHFKQRDRHVHLLSTRLLYRHFGNWFSPAYKRSDLTIIGHTSHYLRMVLSWAACNRRLNPYRILMKCTLFKICNSKVSNMGVRIPCT